jgi:outer membrane receptor protein involved in Fe transport
MIREKMMRKSILRASAALQAVALLGAGSTAFIAAAPAAAQDYTSGTMSGSVTTSSGAPVSGAVVTIKSNQQGTEITTTTNGQGQFSISSLPAGDYDVMVSAAGNRNFTATAVQVQPGRNSAVPVVLSAGTAAASNAIVVSGRRIQAFTGTTTGVNVDVAELTKTVPVGQNLTSVILLAPNTTKGDATFGNLASIGGSSVAENAYYINGLNITNFDNYLGSAEVPFYFYKNVEVKSGGYPAEYGRATGGIVNAVSKAGTNDWTGAVHFDWAPDFLRADDRDLFTCDDDGCTAYTNRHNNKTDTYQLTAELGGPIIRDRLFVYGLLQSQRQDWTDVRPLSGLAYHRKNTDPFWAAKVDAIPIDGQHLEFTIFDTRNTTRRENLAYNEDENGNPSYGAAQAIQDYNYGGLEYVGKYTGRFTDWLTISAAYGRMRDRFDIQGIDSGSGAPYIVNSSGGTLFGVENGQLYTGQTTTLAEYPYTTERKFYRGDIDLRFNMVGTHHVRAGFDREDNTLDHATVRTGGPELCGTGFLSAAACAASNGGGAAILYQPDGQVEINYLVSGGGFTAKNQAYYIEDEWRPTDRLTLNLGARRDDFRLNKQDGTVFLNSANNWQPRIGATYTLWPEKNGTLKAFFGRYYMPFASNTAARQASSEIYFSERYHYSGVDSNFLPILTDQITNYPGFDVGCPFGLTPVSSGQNCQVTGSGETPDTSQATSSTLKASRETEIIFGYEHRWQGWKFGVDFTHRSLDISSEDMAIDAAARAYCKAQGITEMVGTRNICDYVWSGYHQYVVGNPGFPITVALNAGRNGHVIESLDHAVVTLDTAAAGYPKAKRTFDALSFTFDHPWNGRWSLAGSYTWSKSKGNSEGGVQSDYGQTDTGITIDFDQPGFTEYSYGYLPNDRRHRFKLWGAYGITDDFIVGTQMQLSSPRPLSCFGYYPSPTALENGYGGVSHFCGGLPSPRGTAQHSDWLGQVDMSARYNMHITNGSVITLRADVFNVFNSHAVISRYEFGDLAYNPGGCSGSVCGLEEFPADPNFGQPSGYQSPRYVRLGLDVTFGGPSILPPPPPVELAPPPPPPPVATQTCPDGSVIAADAACPVPPPPPPPPPAPVERGERGQ